MRRIDRESREQEETFFYDTGGINWWSWRPGIRPRRALLIGVPIALIALAMLGAGLVTLVLGLADAGSPPLRLRGTIVGHSTGIVDRQPRLAIRLREPGFPPVVAPAVSEATAAALPDGSSVYLDFSPRLHFLYALDDGTRRYALPEANAAGNPGGSVALMIFGLLFLPYPALLALWGWRDLHLGSRELTARVVGLRAVERLRSRNAGLTPRLSRPTWHGLALRPLDDPLDAPLTFSITREQYQGLREDMLVRLTYSPHVRYVYAVERLS